MTVINKIPPAAKWLVVSDLIDCQTVVEGMVSYGRALAEVESGASKAGAAAGSAEA